jgi:UDP-N-acetylglucosamine acyltransferase
LKGQGVVIHKTALIEKGAQLGVGVKVGPFALVGSSVVLEDRVEIKSHAVISGHTVIGEESVIYPFATLGSRPQDLKYNGGNTQFTCGARNSFREYCNISLGTEHGGGKTIIGNDNLFMVNTHVAHDCIVGNHCIFANGVSLAGHVQVDDHVVLGGHSACHQFILIAKHAMIAGGAMVSQDVPPFSLVHGNHAKVKGLNLIGLLRNSFSKIKILEIKKSFKIVFRSQLTIEEAKVEVIKQIKDVGIRNEWSSFLEDSARGICR